MLLRLGVSFGQLNLIFDAFDQMNLEDCGVIFEFSLKITVE